MVFLSSFQISPISASCIREVVRGDVACVHSLQNKRSVTACQAKAIDTDTITNVTMTLSF